MHQGEQNVKALGDLVADAVGLALAIPAAATAWTLRLPFVSTSLTIADKTLGLPFRVVARFLE